MGHTKKDVITKLAEISSLAESIATGSMQLSDVIPTVMYISDLVDQVTEFVESMPSTVDNDVT